MKKAKRFLTGLLSAALALSLCAMPAMAADNGETPSTTPPSTAVWTQNTGSITVHKYELNDDAKKKEGTGNASDEVDSEAKKLAGAEFTIYKIWDEETLKKYYDGVTPVDTTKVFDANNYATKDENTGAWKLELTNGVTAEKVEKEGLENPQTTDVDGVVTFNNLDLGLYLVLETKLPDLVVEAAAPAIISVPMQKDSDNTVAKDQKQPVTEWLYDVHIFPKNSTQYGGVDLIKKGYTGNNDDGVLSNVTYELYKYEGNDEKPVYTEGASDWKKITNQTTTAGDNTGDALSLITDKDGKISIEGLTKGTYCFVEQSAKVKQDGKEYDSAYIVDKEPIYFTVKADGSYTSANKSAVDNALEAKNHKPDVEKKVGMKDASGNINYGKKADYSIGDYVPYQVTITIPQNIEKLDTFVVTDTPTNLEFVKDDNHPFIVKGEGATEPMAENTDYTVVKNDTTKGFTLTFTNPGVTLKGYAGKTVTVTYYAELLDTAVTTTDGNPNTISLKYNQEIGTDGKPTPNKTTEIKNDAVVYSFGIHINKVNGNNEPLQNVKFDLYKVDPTGNITGDKIGLDKSIRLTKVASGLTTDANGEVGKDGLANGTYYLVETETQTGYNLLSGPVKVELKITYMAKWTEKNTYDNEGHLIHHDVSSFKEEFVGGDANGLGYKTQTIINRKGFKLPTTGGFGTLLFSGIGVLLVVAGVGVLLSLKKKNRT